jgi:hypothetical protein
MYESINEQSPRVSLQSRIASPRRTPRGSVPGPSQQGARFRHIHRTACVGKRSNYALLESNAYDREDLLTHNPQPEDGEEID